MGPPKDRTTDDLDAVVEGVIEALKSEWRLYPDIYAWIVTDAVREHLAAQHSADAESAVNTEIPGPSKSLER